MSVQRLQRIVREIADYSALGVGMRVSVESEPYLACTYPGCERELTLTRPVLIDPARAFHAQARRARWYWPSAEKVLCKKHRRSA